MDILSIIKSQLGDQQVDQMSNQTGADKSSMMDALGSIVPVIVGGMARNARSEEGAVALDNALERDHDGSILDNLGGLISNPSSGAGAGILKHVLGGKQEVAQQAVAQKNGISLEAAGQLMQIAAPMVMAYLGKQKRENNLRAGDVAGMVNNAAQASEAPEQGGMGSLVSGLLDRDGDGNVMDDIGGMIGGLFGGKS